MEQTPNVQIEESWKLALAGEFASPYFAGIKKFLVETMSAGHKVYPPGPLIFNAFNTTPFGGKTAGVRNLNQTSSVTHVTEQTFVGAADNVTAFPAKVPKAAMSTQDIISRQCAYNTAIAWVGVLVQAGALTLPAKVGVRNQIMDEILEKYRDEILGWNTGTIKEKPQTDDTTITHEPFTDDSELFE